MALGITRRAAFWGLVLLGLFSCSSTPEGAGNEEAMERGGHARSESGEAAAVMDRSQIPEAYKWRLEDIFPSESDWEKTYEDLKKAIPTIRQWEGKLCDSAETLKMVLDKVDTLSETFEKLYAYATLKRDLNTRDNHARALVQKMRALAVQFGEATSWIQPEILAQPEQDLETLRFNPVLKTYQHELDNLFRLKKHILDRKTEQLLAQAGMVLGAPGNIYNTFNDAEFPNPKVTLHDGTVVELTKPNYVKYRASTNREDRKKVFEAFWGTYQSFKNTLAATYAARLEGDDFIRKARKYDSCLEAALYPKNLPVKLYENLIQRIHEELPTFHRYLKLRKELLGVDTLHYYDIYAPIIEPARLKYTFPQAKELVLEAVKPLGEKYESVLQKALSKDARWVDVFPTKAKRSGAYSSGIYGVHPFVLLNFTGNLDSVSTLAHELGHSMHSYLASHAQPHATAGYEIFVAEVASTFNESLLTHLLLQKAKTDREKLYILGEWMDNYRQTVFRQAMFAEFEWRAHQMVERGEPVTADALNNLYLKLLRLYHGHAEGIMDIEPLYSVEWAYIPHFYRSFYVFTYVTGLISSTALSEKVLEKGEPARKAYLGALAMGGSRYPLEILQSAGADLLTPEPYRIANGVFERRLKMAEEIVKRMKAKGEL